MVHNHDPHIKKLDDRAFKGMFLGFDEFNHNYIIFKLDTNEIIQSRNIRAYPEQTLEFDDNDWDQPFPVENDNNWIIGETNVPPIYDIFNNNEEEQRDSAEEDEEERFFDPDDFDMMGNPVIIGINNNNYKKKNNVRRSSRLQQQSVLSIEEINNILSLEQPETPQSYQEAMRSDNPPSGRNLFKKNTKV